MLFLLCDKGGCCFRLLHQLLEGFLCSGDIHHITLYTIFLNAAYDVGIKCGTDITIISQIGTIFRLVIQVLQHTDHMCFIILCADFAKFLFRMSLYRLYIKIKQRILLFIKIRQRIGPILLMNIKAYCS